MVRHGLGGSQKLKGMGRVRLVLFMAENGFWIATSMSKWEASVVMFCIVFLCFVA